MVNALHRFLVAATLTLVAGQACAWGTQGHQIIAALAQSQLTPAARQEVDRLLALEPGETLESISTWADEHRNPATAAWHYVNFPKDTCNFDADRDCAEGKCVVAAIEKQTRILTSSTTDEKRLLALKYLVHFVGDAHQPLHAGYFEDRGGNTYQLQAFMRGSNLHAVWDSGLIKNLNEDTDAISKRLLNRPSSVVVKGWTPVSAAEESCQIVSSPGFCPPRLVGADYIVRFTPVMETRLVTGGARLAELLNRALK